MAWTQQRGAHVARRWHVLQLSWGLDWVQVLDHCSVGCVIPVAQEVQHSSPFLGDTTTQQCHSVGSVIEVKWLFHSGPGHEHPGVRMEGGARHTLCHPPNLFQLSWFHMKFLAHSKRVNRCTQFASLWNLGVYQIGSGEPWGGDVCRRVIQEARNRKLTLATGGVSLMA